jgi:hypothetical protein
MFFLLAEIMIFLLFLLAKQYEAMDGNLAACRSALQFYNPLKKGTHFSVSA